MSLPVTGKQEVGRSGVRDTPVETGTSRKSFFSPRSVVSSERKAGNATYLCRTTRQERTLNFKIKLVLLDLFFRPHVLRRFLRRCRRAQVDFVNEQPKKKKRKVTCWQRACRFTSTKHPVGSQETAEDKEIQQGEEESGQRGNRCLRALEGSGPGFFPF